MTLSAEFDYKGKPKPEEEKKDDRVVVLKPGERPEDRRAWMELRQAWKPLHNLLLLLTRKPKDEP
jgi:prephenate dehydrogenase